MFTKYLAYRSLSPIYYNKYMKLELFWWNSWFSWMLIAIDINVFDACRTVSPCLLRIAIYLYHQHFAAIEARFKVYADRNWCLHLNIPVRLFLMKWSMLSVSMIIYWNRDYFLLKSYVFTDTTSIEIRCWPITSL